MNIIAHWYFLRNTIVKLSFVFMKHSLHNIKHT